MKIFDPKLTGSIAFENAVQGNFEITGDLVVPGSITAREFKTEFVSASIIYQSGSTQFGNSLDDTHTFTGNIGIGTADTSANLTFTSETGSRKIALYTVSNNDYQFYGFGIADNTLMYHTAATSDDHVFYAGTSTTTRNELVRITGTGHIGIGTVPKTWASAGSTKALQISTRGSLSEAYNGTFLANNYYYDGTERYIETDIASRIALRSDGAIRLQTAASGTADTAITFIDALSVNPSGNVGIGVTTVNYPFQTSDKGVASWNSYFGTGKVRMGGGADHGSNQVLSLAPGRFGIDAPGVVNGRFVVEENGRVGIGINNPTEKLTIQGTGLKFYTTQNVADQYTYIGTEYSNGNGNNKAEIRFAIDGADTRTRIQFHTANGAGNIDERMRINYLGIVGIGTSTMIGDAKVVMHNGNTHLEFSIDNAVADTARLLTYDRDTDTFRNLQLRGANVTLNSPTEEVLRVSSTGYVGIGTTSPGKKLTVRQDENGSPTIIKLENKDGNSNNGAFIGFSTGYNGWAAIGAKREGAENDSSLIFSPMLNESAVERMRITSTGYVGINTDAPAASLHIGNNVSSGGFGGFGDFQILLYQGASAATSYGLGIEGNTLMYNSQNYHKFYSSNNALGFISDDFSTLSNSNAGRHIYENKGNRLLTSNGTGWLADGRDPILTLATSGDSNNLSIAESIGLNLYTAGTTNGVHSPAIAFSNRSNSNDYETAFGIIIGKKTGQGVDANWSAGELHFYTGKEASYMDNNPDLRITSQGHILTIRQPAFFAHTGPTAYSSTTTAIPFSVEFTDNGNNYNSTNGRFTAPVTGRYYFFASVLHRMSSSSGSGEISFYKNGANVNSRGLGYAGGGTLDDDHDQVSISMIISLAAGDYVTVGVYSISSGQDFYSASGLSHFGGYLIG